MPFWHTYSPCQTASFRLSHLVCQTLPHSDIHCQTLPFKQSDLAMHCIRPYPPFISGHSMSDLPIQTLRPIAIHCVRPCHWNSHWFRPFWSVIQTLLFTDSTIPCVRPLIQTPGALSCRSKVFEDIDRMIHPETIYDHIVYDLDGVVAGAGAAYCQENSNLSNRDELR